MLRVVAVGVDPPEPVHVLLEEEGEGREREGRAEPDEAVGPPLDPAAGTARRAGPRTRCSRRRRRGSGPHPGTAARSAHLRLVLERHAEAPRTGAAGCRAGAAATCRRSRGRVEVRTCRGSGCRCRPSGRRRGVISSCVSRSACGEVLEGRVGEDDAEAERVVGAVALDDGDVVRGIGLLHEDREVEAGRTAADADDPQPRASFDPGAPGDPVRTRVGDDVGGSVSPRVAPAGACAAAARARVDPPSERRLYCAP